jgi:two-component system CheB/CheR fusion protein
MEAARIMPEDQDQSDAVFGADMSLLRHMLDEHPDAQAVVDESLRYVYANKAYLAGWGLSGLDVAGRPVSSVVSPKLYEATVRDALKHCLAGEKTQYGTWIEYPGGRRYKLVNYTPLRPDGAARYILVSIVDMTEKKRVEEEVGRQQTRLKSILDALGFGVLIVDDEHRVQFVNAFVEREFGPAGSDPCHKYLQGRDAPCPWCKSPEVFSGRTVAWEWESPVSARTYERREAMIAGSGGGSAKLQVFRDITPHLELKKRLHDMESKFQTLVNEAPDAIFIQTGGTFAFMNKAAVELFGGTSAGDFLGRSVAAHFHPDCAAQVGERIRRLNEKREAVPLVEENLVRRDGSVVAAEVVATPFAWDGKDGALVFARNVSERKAAERELEQSRMKFIEELTRSQEYYLKVLEDFPAMVWRADPAGNIDYVNRTWLAFTGRTLDQERGLGWLAGVHREDRASCREVFSRARRDMAPFSLEYRLKRHDGVYRYLADHGRPFYDLDGEFRGYMGSCRDVTERKAHERDILMAKEAAESASRSKSEFLANMSHEIRTPLNGVMGMLQLMQTTGMDAEQTEYVGTALESSRKLLVILNDVLDLSRVESGRIELRLAEVDLHGLLRSVAGMFTPQAREKNIALELDIHPDTPRACVFDETRLRQVLFNLVGNAVKFTEKGGVALRVRPEQGASGAVAMAFTVEDTGIGIPREQHAYIFENFTQADGCLTRKHGGAGLGLAIVKRLVALMGGEVGLESEPGEGSRFFFTLRSAAPRDVADERPRPLPGPAAGGGAKTILVVEDDPQNLMFLKRSLEKLGYAVVAAENGREGVLAANREGLGLIVMDVQMPVMDGLEATRIIRSGNGPSAARPIVVLTAHAMLGDRERCLAAGADEYLTKPVEILKLHAVIERLLAARPGRTGRPGRAAPENGS